MSWGAAAGSPNPLDQLRNNQAQQFATQAASINPMAPADIYRSTGLGFNFPSYIPYNAYQQRPIMQQPYSGGLGAPGTLQGDMMRAVLSGWANQPQMPMPSMSQFPQMPAPGEPPAGTPGTPSGPPQPGAPTPRPPLPGAGMPMKGGGTPMQIPEAGGIPPWMRL